MVHLYTVEADPQSFVRGVPILIFFYLVEEERKYPNTTIRGHIECLLGSSVIFRGSGPVLLRNPLFFVIFQGRGVRTPCSPSGSAHVEATLFLFNGIAMLDFYIRHSVTPPIFYYKQTSFQL